MNNIIDPSLVLYAPLNWLDGSSQISRDAYGHTMSITGALWTSMGRNFDGVDDAITVPDSSPLDIAGPLTMMAWIKVNIFPDEGYTSRRILVKREGAGGGYKTPYHMTFYYSGGSVLLQCYIYDSLDTAVGLDQVVDSSFLNTWHLLSGTYSSDGKTRLYVNGNLVKTSGATGNGGVRTSSEDLCIGGWSAGYNAYDGTIGEVLIFSRTLNAPEIHNYYLATKWRYQ